MPIKKFIYDCEVEPYFVNHEISTKDYALTFTAFSDFEALFYLLDLQFKRQIKSYKNVTRRSSDGVVVAVNI